MYRPLFKFREVLGRPPPWIHTSPVGSVGRPPSRSLGRPPPVVKPSPCGQTNACENITLPQMWAIMRTGKFNPEHKFYCAALNRILLIYTVIHSHRLPRKLREGSVLSRVCPSVCPRFPCDHYPCCIGPHCTAPPPSPLLLICGVWLHTLGKHAVCIQVWNF